MKILFTLLTMVISTSLLAEYVGSPIKGATVIFLAEAGTTVKKDQPLFKLLDRSVKILIEKRKLKLKIALADLVDKKSDIKRSKNLVSIKAISLAMHENYVVEYYKSLLKTERLKIKIKQAVYDLEGYIGNAPYDCIVLKQIVCVNAGTDDSTYLLEIQPLDDKSSITDTSTTMKLTAAFNEQITYLPKEGQIVKKGDLLVKFDSGNLEMEIKLLENSLKEANQCLKDSTTDIERSKTLVKEKTISPKLFEDVQFLFKKCSIDVDILKLELKETKDIINEDFVVYAPYDLKTTKLILSVGSGTNDGSAILLVQKI